MQDIVKKGLDEKDIDLGELRRDLTPDEYQRCLGMAELAVFMKGETMKNPKSIFVIAQAGAGKTGLRSFAVNEAQNNNGFGKYIEFNPDDIAIYRKYYKEIIEYLPEESYKILQKFVQPALDTYLRQRAVDLRNNIVQEGTFGNTEAYINILEFQKNGGDAEIGKLQQDNTRQVKHVNGGYNIDINILAVDRLESLLSCYEREQYFFQNDLPPRAVTVENHDRAYENMLETVRIIEQRKLYDRIRVFKRGYLQDKPELAYVAGDSKYPSVVQAIIEERAKNKRELLSKPEEYLGRINELKNKIEEKGSQSLKNRVENLEQIYLSELEKENNIQR